jgi:hypothetical protein
VSGNAILAYSMIAIMLLPLVILTLADAYNAFTGKDR